MGFLDKVAKKEAKKGEKPGAKKGKGNLNKLLLDDDISGDLTPEVDITFRAKETKEDKIHEGERILKLDTDQVSNKEQVRKKFDPEYISQLGQAMKRYGQYSPIIVSPPDEEGGLYVIQQGECRWRGAKEAGIQVDVVVRDAPKTKSEAIIGELNENIHRYELECLELAGAIHELQQEGMSIEDIAGKLEKPQKYVYRYAQLINLPDIIRELAADGIVTDAQTLNELRKIHGVNEDRAKALCSTARTEGITRMQCARYLKEEKDLKKGISSTQPPSSTNSDAESNASNDTSAQSTPGPSLAGNSAADFGNRDLDPPVNPGQPGVSSMTGMANSNLGQSDPSSGQPEKPVKQRQYQRYADYAYLDLEGESHLAISVLVEENNLKGVLCLNRVDEDNNYLWVDLKDGKGSKIRAHRNDIKILSASEEV